MRRLPLAIAAAAALLIFPISAFSQSVQIGPGGVRVDDGQGARGGGQCEELRLACEEQAGRARRGKLPSVSRDLPTASSARCLR